MKFLFPVAVSLVFILMAVIVSCTILCFQPAEQIALQSIARKAGFIFGKQHPEMIPQARLIALGIEASNAEDVKNNFDLAVDALIKYFPDPILKTQVALVIDGIEKTNADLDPIVLAFIEGMEKSL